MAKGFDLNTLIDNLEPGLDRAILRLMSFHIGQEKTISRQDLLNELHNQGFGMGDRAVRAQINLLRKQGEPICSTGGVDGGYYYARDWRELMDYTERELHSRAMDLLEQEQALKHSAKERWGDASSQMNLF